MKAHMIRFTKFLDKLFRHEKKRTIRKVSESEEHNPEVGDKLHIWALFKVGEAQTTKVTPFKLKDLTNKDARSDGFNSATEGIEWFMKTHKAKLDDMFQIIDFDPKWKPFARKPILFVDFTEAVDKTLYKKLMIDLAQPTYIGIGQKVEGLYKIPAIGARSNAWVCALCHRTAYSDPLQTKLETGEFELTDIQQQEVDMNGFITTDPPEDYMDSMPVALFLDKEGEELRQITFCQKCADTYSILKVVGTGEEVYMNE